MHCNTVRKCAHRNYRLRQEPAPYHGGAPAESTAGGSGFASELHSGAPEPARAAAAIAAQAPVHSAKSPTAEILGELPATAVRGFETSRPLRGDEDAEAAPSEPPASPVAQPASLSESDPVQLPSEGEPRFGETSMSGEHAAIAAAGDGSSLSTANPEPVMPVPQQPVASADELGDGAIDQPLAMDAKQPTAADGPAPRAELAGDGDRGQYGVNGMVAPAEAGSTDAGDIASAQSAPVAGLANACDPLEGLPAQVCIFALCCVNIRSATRHHRVCSA